MKKETLISFIKKGNQNFVTNIFDKTGAFELLERDSNGKPYLKEIDNMQELYILHENNYYLIYEKRDLHSHKSLFLWSILYTGKEKSSKNPILKWFRTLKKESLEENYVIWTNTYNEKLRSIFKKLNILLKEEYSQMYRNNRLLVDLFEENEILPNVEFNNQRKTLILKNGTFSLNGKKKSFEEVCLFFEKSEYKNFFALKKLKINGELFVQEDIFELFFQNDSIFIEIYSIPRKLFKEVLVF